MHDRTFFSTCNRNKIKKSKQYIKENLLTVEHKIYFDVDIFNTQKKNIYICILYLPEHGNDGVIVKKRYSGILIAKE